MVDTKEKLLEILRMPIYLHELADPTEAVADYLLDNNVVPVVRCKECVYYLAEHEHCGWWDVVMPPEGYCHKGEKESTQECQACAIEGLDQAEVE